MSGFKRKPLPDELTAALKAGVRDVPAAVVTEGDGRGARAPRTLQINFNASERMAEIVAEEAQKVGSTRRFFARLMRDAGYDIPDADVFPLDNRRRFQRGRPG